MSFVRNIALTIDGNPVNGLSIAVGSTLNWDLICMDPDDISVPLDITGAAVLMAVVALDSQGRPLYPATISHQATITDGPAGECYVPWASGDTVIDGAPIPLGSYGLDIWAQDVDGNRIQELGFSIITIGPSANLPDSLITALPAQEPLAQGPAGTPSITGVVTFAGSDDETVTITEQPSAAMDIQLTLKDADAFVGLMWEEISTTQFRILASAPFTGSVCYAVLI